MTGLELMTIFSIAMGHLMLVIVWGSIIGTEGNPSKTNLVLFTIFKCLNPLIFLFTLYEACVKFFSLRKYTKTKLLKDRTDFVKDCRVLAKTK